MAGEQPSVKSIFEEAVEIASPEERAAYLERACGGDAQIRRKVEALLRALDEAGSFLEASPVFDTLKVGGRAGPEADPEGSAASVGGTSGPPPSDTLPGEGAPGDVPHRAPRRTGSHHPPSTPGSLIGSVIAGRYKLREEIGEGGMGTVYLAEQTQPIKRKVALKLIKAGMDSRTVLARFESERQALALMDHPNIAKVLDAGSTESGHPFFVMELVKGLPVTDYCDQHRLGLPERLALFRQVCSAVQHAHQKGIIHRDLKPSNILVESHDEKPVPKVIDFGLAKATSGLQLSENSIYSGFGTVAGTPLYMAPEQASFNALDVDTRADIYALGVILYELLTGSTPIERETFRLAALDEILRVIREVEPPTPSNRLSSSESLPSLAATRHMEPGRLSRFVRGDLDWIVMKALSKDRQRRYDSAIGLANDLERFLNHEPVSAGPPSAMYRFTKFVRRNRAQVVAASLVLLALVAGVVGTTMGLFEARHQEQLAVKAAYEEGKARESEAFQRKQAESRLVKIEKANVILGSMFKDLNLRNPEKESKPLAARLGERLDQATAEIEGESIGDPLAVARMQLILGESQLGLNYPEKAITLLTKARATFTSQLGPDHEKTLETMGNLAVAYRMANKLDLALPLYEETLALRKAKLGPDHRDTLQTMSNFAVALLAAGKLDRAVPLMEETLTLQKAKLGPGDPDTIGTMANLANGYRTLGKLDRALPLLEEALALRKANLGPDHPRTLTTMSSLAVAYQNAGKVDLALKLHEETLALQKATLGPDDLDTLSSMSNLAQCYVVAGKVDLAVPLFEKTLTLMRAKLDPDHPAIITTMNNLGLAYKADGQLDRAMRLLEETLALRKAKQGRDHPDTLISMNNLAREYQDAGQLDRAFHSSRKPFRS